MIFIGIKMMNINKMKKKEMIFLIQKSFIKRNYKFIKFRRFLLLMEFKIPMKIINSILIKIYNPIEIKIILIWIDLIYRIFQMLTRFKVMNQESIKVMNQESISLFQKEISKLMILIKTKLILKINYRKIKYRNKTIQKKLKQKSIIHKRMKKFKNKTKKIIIIKISILKIYLIINKKH